MEKRCSDYDSDCREVRCYVSCWMGGRSGDFWTPPADGYCPYLRKDRKYLTADELEIELT